MTVHLLKLCVGCDTIQDLKDWQEDRLRQLKRKREPVGTLSSHVADAEAA